jgi:CDP-glucose 4,6-dehydratase
MKNILKNSNILVTGGTGLVGAHLVEALLAHSPHKIVSTIRTWDPFSYFFINKLDEQVVLAEADIRNYDRVIDIITKHEIDIIYHLAAQPIVGSAYSFPRQTIASNVNGTINILEAARQSKKIKAVIVASSDKAYGKCDCLPYTEDTKLEGLHPYDSSKSATDLLTRSYYGTYQLPVVVTRFGNIYGPGDDNFNRIIPGIIKALIHNEDFDIRSDGKMIREYLFVKDVARGYVSIAENIEKIKGEAFNFGSKNIYSVVDIAKKVMKVYGKEVKLNILNQAKNEIPAQHLDFTKAKKLLNWQGDTPIEEALRITIDWYKKYFDAIHNKRHAYGKE